MDRNLLNALKKHFGTEDIMAGKGGFWVKGHPFVTIKQARQLTGVKGIKRAPRGERILAWGDYATIAMINGVKR